MCAFPVLAAMVDWVENGNPPKEFVAAKYTNNNATQGVQFTRKLCPVSLALTGHRHTMDKQLTRIFWPSIPRRQYTREATRTRPTHSFALERSKERSIPVCNEEANPEERHKKGHNYRYYTE